MTHKLTPEKRSKNQALTNLHLEIVERVFVDMFHLLHEPHGVVCQGSDVGTAHLIIGAGIQPGGSHIGAANRLDLLQLPKPLLADDLDRGAEGEGGSVKLDSGLFKDHSLLLLGSLPPPPLNSPIALGGEPPSNWYSQ